MTCIELDTPQSIMDEGNDFYPAGTDIFAEVFTDSTLSNASLMQAALWAVYRLRMIGSCRTDEWVQALRDRLAIVGPKWDAIMTKAADTDLTDMEADSYERIVRRTAIEGTDGDERTVKRTAISGTQGDSRTVTTEHESLPQVAATATRYLDTRNTVTEGYTPNTQDSERFAPNTQDSETYKESRDIAARTFAEMMSAYPDILGGFAVEFDGYFLAVIG